MIDNMLDKAGNNCQQLNFRVMCQDVEITIPQWFDDLRTPLTIIHGYTETLLIKDAALSDKDSNI